MGCGFRFRRIDGRRLRAESPESGRRLIDQRKSSGKAAVGAFSFASPFVPNRRNFTQRTMASPQRSAGWKEQNKNYKKKNKREKNGAGNRPDATNRPEFESERSERHTKKFFLKNRKQNGRLNCGDGRFQPGERVRTEGRRGKNQGPSDDETS